MVLIISLLILGFIGGVFINYLADFLPIKRKLTVPFCQKCLSNQGLTNYFLWPRRCPKCGQKRKTRTYIVEIIIAISTVYLWYFPVQRMNFIFGLILWIYFVLVIVIDLEHRLILHPVSIAGTILGLGMGVWMHGFIPTLFGGVFGFLIMLVLYYFGILLIKWIKKGSNDVSVNVEQSNGEALGFGDVNLCGVVGLLLGWPGIIAGITITIFLAGGFSLFYLIYMLINKKYHAYMAIPYGPFIIIGTVILLYFVN